MNKEIEVLKIEGYDDFKCIADKCKFTCCAGWDVNIDDDTYNRWKCNEKKYILEKTMTIDDEDEALYFINKETYEACPFLDKKGLCNIVKKDGEEYLSLTCQSFPRIENIVEDKKELTLSCACPEVVEIINNIDGNIKMISTENDLKETSLRFRIRELLINIIEEKDILLEDKLIACFEILLNIFNDEDTSEEIVLEKYKDKNYIKDIIEKQKDIKINLNEAIEEINYLFLDITENYKDVVGLENSLRDLSKFAEKFNKKKVINKWESYKNDFDKFNNLIENCIVSKIYGSCVSDDIEEILLNFELIILEYLLVRYSVFLKSCLEDTSKISIEYIKDYIVVFSRVISNNSDAVLEFLEDGFGDAILDIEYIKFITM